MFEFGSFQLRNALFLAPMVGVSDTPFREICSEHGAGLTCAEMLTSNSSLWHNERNRFKRIKPKNIGPHVVQIAGSDPDLMAQAAELNVLRGADAIDINMGCPAKKVLKKAAGSALLKDSDLVRRILSEVVSRVDVPVSLKIRTGWCPKTR
ncbi:MAG: tRNA dihydrouridine synthase DusB, partial [SAR86 cluster bacterium]